MAKKEHNLLSNAFHGEKERSEDAESKRTRVTYSLKNTDRWTYQDTKKNLSKQGALTNWRVQTDGQVRTRKESK